MVNTTILLRYSEGENRLGYHALCFIVTSSSLQILAQMGACSSIFGTFLVYAQLVCGSEWHQLICKYSHHSKSDKQKLYSWNLHLCTKKIKIHHHFESLELFLWLGTFGKKDCLVLDRLGSISVAVYRQQESWVVVGQN